MWLLGLILGGIGLFFIQYRHLVTVVGIAQGTELRVSARVPLWVSSSQVEHAVISELNRIDSELSTYRWDSEISHFNRALSDQKVAISSDFATAFRFGDRLNKVTNGAWDGTVFGDVVGWRWVAFEGGNLRKHRDGVKLTLDSVAQGLSLDRVVERLRQIGADGIRVQLGGEVRIWNSERRAVSVRVARPFSDYDRSAGTIVLVNEAISTSGEEDQGSKIIDPSTGRPVVRDFWSIVVVAPTGMEADGLSTALWLTPRSEWRNIVSQFRNIRVFVVNTEMRVIPILEQ